MKNRKNHEIPALAALERSGGAWEGFSGFSMENCFLAPESRRRRCLLTLKHSNLAQSGPGTQRKSPEGPAADSQPVWAKWERSNLLMAGGTVGSANKSQDDVLSLI